MMFYSQGIVSNVLMCVTTHTLTIYTMQGLDYRFNYRAGLCAPSTCDKEDVEEAIETRLTNFTTDNSTWAARVFSDHSRADRPALDWLDIVFMHVGLKVHF